ncbi:MAG: LTA synthase family protein [Ruminococcaceae bacterium]|nr:LTA synthase family protein [Oscillospiraceae bacterium]
MKPFFTKIKELCRRIIAWFGAHPAATIVVMALGVGLCNEILSRRSLFAAVGFAVTKPLSFLCNVAIVSMFLSLTLLFKRRNILMCLVSLLWLAMGIANFVVCCFRATPFSAMDFILVLSVFPILPRYLTWPGLILLVLALLALIGFLIRCLIRAKRIPVRRAYAFTTVLCSVAVTAVLIASGYLSGIFPRHFSNLATAYREHGFTFSFSVILLDQGIDEPKDYDDEKIHEILSGIQSGTPDSAGDTDAPNVIFLQLESFYDPKLLQGFTFTEDPTPVFTELRDRCQSGVLTVPSVGAGTANTEFEVLAGMSLQWFGAGEYPYETILQRKTCESVAYNLKEHGYTAHAVHNYKGNFYDRNDVFSRLGFDTFTSLEYMNDVTYNAGGWAKDTVLLRYIETCLSTTKGPDLVYGITVQGHGKYSVDAEEDASPHIGITACPEETDADAFTYYVNQLHETDAFLGALISSLEATGEETYVVLFGDHLPNIGIEEDRLPAGMTLYDTEYLIWHSGGETAPDQNLKAYQLSAAVMSRLGWNDGVLTKLHQTWADKKDYLVYLEMLQYDILYGQGFCYGGEIPFKPTDLKMGVLDIEITDVRTIGENTYVKGKNFTPYSHVYVNGFPRSVEFVDENTLMLTGFLAEKEDVFRVVQITDGIFQLSTTEDYVWK